MTISFLDITAVRGTVFPIIYSVTSFLTFTDDTPFLSSVAGLLELLSPLSPGGLSRFPPPTLVKLQQGSWFYGLYPSVP